MTEWDSLKGILEDFVTTAAIVYLVTGDAEVLEVVRRAGVIWRRHCEN